MPDKKTKSMLYRQSEVDYVTVSPETGVRQCANCRWFCPQDVDYDANGDMIPVSTHCKIVEPYPLAILPTGMCNRHELFPETENEIAPMEVVIVDVDADEVEMQFAPKRLKRTGLRRFFGKDPHSTLVWREASGLRRMLIVTSNGYEDREREHVAQRALQGYVDEAYNEKGDYTAANKLLFYHDKALDIGDIISADMIDGFLVELAQERDGSPVAKSIWDYVESTAADGSVEWGASHGFRAKQQGNTYVRIQKKETTVLDIRDAANPYTQSGVLP